MRRDCSEVSTPPQGRLWLQRAHPERQSGPRSQGMSWKGRKAPANCWGGRGLTSDSGRVAVGAKVPSSVGETDHASTTRSSRSHEARATAMNRMHLSSVQIERHALQVVVTVASLVPIAAGASGMLMGPIMLGDRTIASADLDGHFRYLSGLLLGIGLGYLSAGPGLNGTVRDLFCLAAWWSRVGSVACSRFYHKGPPRQL
jgi:hypothetical protein